MITSAAAMLNLFNGLWLDGELYNFHRWFDMIYLLIMHLRGASFILWLKIRALPVNALRILQRWSFGPAIIERWLVLTISDRTENVMITEVQNRFEKDNFWFKKTLFCCDFSHGLPSLQWDWKVRGLRFISYARLFSAGGVTSGALRLGATPGPGGGGGGYSVRFRIGMLLTARRLETLQGSKRGVETIHFAQFWWKIGVEIRHFPHFC